MDFQLEEVHAPPATGHAPLSSGLHVRLVANNSNSGEAVTTSIMDLPESTGLNTTWGEIKRLVSSHYSQIMAYRVNGLPATLRDDNTPMHALLGVDPSAPAPDEIEIQVTVSQADGQGGEDDADTLQGTEASPFFRPESVEDARRESERYLARARFLDGTTKTIGSHSYDRFEGSDGSVQYVDQMACSSVKIVVEGVNDQGEQVKVELTSQQCMIVDRKDPNYDPYILLSNSGRRALDDIQPLQMLMVQMDRRQETPEVIQPVAPHGAVGQQQSFVGRVLNVVRERIHDGTFTRIFAYISNVMFRYVPLVLLSILLDYCTPFYLLLLGLIALATPALIDQLEEIARQDMPEQMAVYLLRFVGFLRFGHRCFERLNLNSFGQRLVDFGIGNDRPNLTLETEQLQQQHRPDQKQTMGQKLGSWTKVVVQDAVLAVATIFPSFFAIYDYELVRREGLVKQQNEARQAAVAEGNHPDAIESGETEAVEEDGNENENAPGDGDAGGEVDA